MNSQEELPGSRKRSIDVWLFLAIVVAAALVGAWFVNSNIVKKFHFYQETFAPAVMAACGRGFVQPAPAPEAMTAFLEVQTGSFDCNAILPNQKSVAPGLFQIVHRNLMLTVAGWWRAFGVSWASLTTLYGLVYGLSAGFAYLVLRTAMGRPLAVALTCVFILSPPQLFNLPHLRDYLKAPFMLAAIAAMAWLLKGRRHPERVIWTLAAIGLFIGIGIGVRFDLIILVPLFVVLILFMQPGSWLAELKMRIALTACFLICFSIAASPTLMSLTEGSNMPHVIILGLMGEFDQRLGLDPAFYELGYHYLDLYVHTLVNSFANASGYTGQTIPYPSALYDNSGISYIVDVFRTFPADMVARYFSSMWRILHLPIVVPVTFEDLYFFYDEYRPQWLMTLTHHPVWEIVLIGTVTTSAVLIASRSFKLLVSIFLVTCYLCGYPFLQFGVRHYFYLEVIGLWMFGLCIQYVLLNPLQIWRARRQLNTEYRFAQTREYIRAAVSFRVAGALVLIFGVPFAILGVLRLHQSKDLSVIFASYASAPTTSIAAERTDGEGGWKIHRLTSAGQYADAAQPQSVKTLHLAATFDSRRCNKHAVHVRFKYQSIGPTYDFSRTKSMGIDGHTKVFFPAFFQPGLSTFSGIEMPSEEFACLVSIEQLAVKPPLRIPLTMTLPQNWMVLPRYRTFH